MSNVEDLPPTIGERYSSACESTNLKLSERRGDVDMIIAAALLPDGLACTLYRLQVEFDSLRDPLDEARRWAAKQHEMAAELRKQASRELLGRAAEVMSAHDAFASAKREGELRKEAEQLSAAAVASIRTEFVIALDRLGTGETAPASAALARKLLVQGDGQTVAFVLRLNRWIFGHLRSEHREHGEAWPADQTLLEQRGSCRDLARLYMACARALGLPARFVSGYYEGDPSKSDKDLHAWVEVYLPGGGWRGFDPSCGLAVADRHIALCAAPEPEGAAAISGTYGAPTADGSLVAQIRFL